MFSAISFDSEFGMVLSVSQDSTSVGHLIQASEGREFDPADHGGLLPDKIFRADILAHVVAELAKSGILAARRMDEAGKQLVQHGAVLAALRALHHAAAAGGRLRPYPISPAYSSAPVWPPAPGPAA